LIPRLLAALDGFTDVQVVPDPGATDKTNAWRSHHAVLQAMPEHATHLLCLQDDALPVAGFSEKVLGVLLRHPESVLLAFVPGFARERRLMGMAKTARQDICPFVIGAYVPTVAIVYPRDVVNGLLAWAEGTRRDGVRRPIRGADDGIVALYCRKQRIRPLALVPCLVEHDETVEPVGKTARSGPHRRAALL
jgi:hypothetical protein